MTLTAALCASHGAFATACSSPAGNPGDIVYGSNNIMAYCNGTVWVNMGTNLAIGFGTLTSGDFCTATSGTQISCTTATINLSSQASGTLQAAQEPAHTGDVTNTAGSLALTIGANKVSMGDIAQIAGLSVLGNNAASTGNVGAITGAANQVLVVNSGGTALAFGAVNIGSSASITGNLPVTNLNSGTGASSTTFWRGDGTWAGITGSSITGTVGVANGGTGDTSLTSNGVLYGQGTGSVAVTSAPSQYNVLVGNASGIPVFGQLALNQAAAVTGTLPVANGGTGLATLTANVIYKGNGTGNLATSALTDNGTIVSSSESIDATTNAFVTEIANDTTTGTTVNLLAKLTTAGKAVVATTADTDGTVGIVTGNAGKTGSAQVAVGGQASCAFDGATTAGDYVTISATVAGDCSDAGAAQPVNQTIGRVLSTNASAGSYAVAIGFVPSADAGGDVTGSGITNYVARWTSSTNLGTGKLYDNGTSVGIGTTAPAYNFQVTNLGIGNGSIGFTSSGSAGSAIVFSNSGSFVSNNGGSNQTLSFGVPNISGASFAFTVGTTAGGSGGTTVASINQSGVVGIGTTTMSSSNKLEVNGAASIGYPNTYGGSAGGLIVAGNVGIGTTSPGYPLSLGNSVGDKLAVYDVGAGSIYGFGIGSSRMFLKIAGAELMSFNNGTPLGSVGIGTTNPLNNLQVGTQTSVPTATPVTLSLGATYSSTPGANIKLKVYDAGTNVFGFGASAQSMDALVTTGSSYNWYEGTTNVMTINGSGFVGIGTMSPLSSLSVAGNLAIGAYGAGAGATAAPTGGLIVSGPTGIGTNSVNSSIALGVNGPLYVTTSPTALITTANGQTASNFINNFNSNTGMLIRKTGAGTGDYFDIETSAASPVFMVSSAGNVGIGTTTPTGTLQVNPQSGGSTSGLIVSGSGGAFSSVGIDGAASATAYLNIGGSGGVGVTSASTTFGIQLKTGSYGSGDSVGVASYPITNYAGTVNNVYAFTTQIRVGNGSETLTNGYNYLAGSQFGTQPITNMYGLYVAAQKTTGVTNGYGVYVAGTSDLNYFAGQTAIGTTTPNTSALLQLYSTTQGFLPPLWSTANEVSAGTSLPAGLTVYNTTNNELETFNGTAWEAVGANAADAGGSNTQLQYNNGGDLGGTAGLTWDNTNNVLTLAGGALTGTTSYPAFSVTQTWNNAGGTFTGIYENVTNTASNSNSLLLDLQVGGVEKFHVREDGSGAFVGQITSGSSITATTNVISGSTAGFGIGSRSYIASPADGSLELENNAGTSLVYFSWPSSNVLHLGLADAAAPVAQTLGVQNVVAGTTNTAGVNFTIDGSQGTGTGAGGAIQFQTAPAGLTGTSQNALSPAMIILGNGDVGIGTTNPTAGLAVMNGNVAIGAASASAPLDVYSVNSSLGPTGGAVIRLDNGSGTGQDPLDFFVNGTLRGRLRANYAGSVFLVSNGGGQYFEVGGDANAGAGGSSAIMMYISSYGVQIGTNNISTSALEVVGQNGLNVLPSGFVNIGGGTVVGSPSTLTVNTSNTPSGDLGFLVGSSLGPSLAVTSPNIQQIVLTAGTSWTVPSNWNSSNNSIEVIGGGGGYNGGGGAYAKITNLSLTPSGSVAYQIGGGGTNTGGTGGDTYFNGTGTTCSAQSVCAKGGNGGNGGTKVGGAAGSSVGTLLYSGGNGANNDGGGAAGPSGAGNNAPGGPSFAGGSGDAGVGGAGGPNPGAGGNGTEWGSSAGSGGGGGGCYTGAVGGNYGGGGSCTAPGTQGVIVITYTPVSSTGNVGIGTSAPTSALQVVGTVTDTGETVTGNATVSGTTGIGTTSPNASAALDVYSTTQGLLPPRMGNTARNAISSPATGLTIYNTDTSELETFNGTAWEAVGANAADAGGTNTQLQYNNGGDLGGTAGLTWDSTNDALTLATIANQTTPTLTLTGGTAQTTSQPVLSVTQTWNNASTLFDAPIFENITNTASIGTSKLIDLQVSGTSKFNVNVLGQSTAVSSFAGLIETTGGIGGGINSSGIEVSTGAYYAFSSTSSAVGTADTFLTRQGAANLHLGNTDAAAPVAQTLGVQNVVAGTTNTAGVNFTIDGSQGTGTGAGGAIQFQTAPAGVTGTSQNALSPAMIILGNGDVGIGTTSPTNLFQVGPTNVHGVFPFAVIETSGTGFAAVDAAPSTSALLQVGINGNGMGFGGSTTSYGIYTLPTSTGSGDLWGVFSWPVSQFTGGSVVNTGAYLAQIRIVNNETLTNGYGFVASTPLISSGTITNMYGINIGSQKIAGVTNGYGVYQTSSADTNYFAGNVGIGTTAPASALHVVGTVSIDGLDGQPITWTQSNLNDSNVSAHFHTSFGLWIRSNVGGAASRVAGIDDQITNNGANLELFANSAARMTINSSGNVGIGTTAPGDKLQVTGGNIDFDDNYGIWGGGSSRTAGFYTASGALHFRTGNVDERLVILSNGNVGLGTTSATQKLTVAGNVDTFSGSGYLTEIPNDGTTGTATGKLAKLSAAGAAVLATTADTDGMVGVVAGGAGTTGNAQIAVGGQVSCVFDNATTAGDYVTISTGTAGDCSDAGASEPINQTIGRVLSTNVGAGTYTIAMGLVPAADAGGDVTGSGTTNYVARWTSSTNLGTGTLYDTGTQVGIGTTAPIDSLDVNTGNIVMHVNGQILVRTTTTGIQLSSAGVAIKGNASGQQIAFFVASAPANSFYLNSSGNVGIGTTAPTSELSVYGSSGSSSIISLQNTGSSNYEGFNTYDNGGTLSATVAYANSAAANLPGSFWLGPRNATSSLYLIAGSVTPTPQLTILPSGNVGIGSTAPGAPLVVSTTGSGTTGVQTTVLSVNTVDSSGSGARMVFHQALDEAAITGWDSNNWGGYMTFATAPSTGTSPGGTLTERMRITDAGNVGIGTTSPGTALDIQGGGILRIGGTTSPVYPSTGQGFEIAFDADGQVGSVNGGNGVSVFQSYSRDASTYRDLWFRGLNIGWGVNGQTAPSLYLASIGNVGIGTTLPTDILDVNGGIGLTATTATVPTNGMYVSTTNTVALTSGGTVKLFLGPTTASIAESLKSVNGNGPFISIGSAGITAPQFEPNQADQKAGIGNDTAGDVSIVADNGGTATEMLRVTGTSSDFISGNVGIGTTAPTQKLTVNGNVDTFSGSGYLSEIPNDGTTGTATGKLAKLSAAGAAVLATTADTDGMVGVVAGGAGTTGNAQIAVGGQVSCVFDNATTAGDYVTISTGTAGDCSDAGASEPINQTIGRVLSTNVGAGTYTIAMGLVPAADAGGDVTGTGTTNYVARWTSATNLGTGTLYDNGTNVGIGTVSPPQNLTVIGSAGITGTLYVNNNGTGTGSGSTGAIQIGDGVLSKVFAGPFSFNAGGTFSNILTTRSALFIGASGSPTHDLSFNGGVAREIWVERGTSIGNTLTVQAGGGVALGTNEIGGNLILASGISTGNGTSNIQFNVYGAGVSGTADNSPNTAMTIASTGSVGIGTATPGALLNLWGTNNPQLEINYDALDYTSLRTTSTGAFVIAPDSGVFYVGPYAPATGLYVAGNGTSATVGIGTNSSSNSLSVYGDVAIGQGYTGTAAPANGAIIQGNVGIGLALPFAALDVNAGQIAGIETALVLRSQATSANGNGAGIIFRMPDSAAANQTWGEINNVVVSNTAGSINGALAFQTVGAGTLAERMRIDSAGNVGIGTTAPSYTLDVSGQARILSTVAGSVFLSGYGFTNFTGSPNIHGGIQFTNASNASSWIGQVAGNGHIGFGTGATENMDLDSVGNLKLPNGALIVSGAGNSSFVGNVGIGTTAPNASALLQVYSTTKGFLPPLWTTANEVSAGTSLPTGLTVYNTTNNELETFNGTSWEAVGANAADAGGSNTQLQYNNGGDLGGTAGLTWDNTNNVLTLAGGALTGTTSYPALSVTQTWNNAGGTFTGILENITNTASNASSKLMDLQAGGLSRLNVTVGGTVTMGGGQIFSAGGSATIPGNMGLTSASSVLTWNASGAAYISSPAAATVHIGNYDAASPIAQTLGVQNVIAGTTNTAGANFTITGSQGTGTGAGGSILFQTAPAGVTGTAQNALATVMTITSQGVVGIGTSVPVAGLDVERGSGNVMIINNNNATGAALQVKGATLFDVGLSSQTAMSIFGRASQSVPIFEVGALSTTQGLSLTVGSNGNVGIGTTSAAQLLEVNGAALFDGVIYAAGQTIAGNSSGNTTALYGGLSNHGGEIDFAGASAGTNAGTLTFYTGTASGKESEHMRIDASGNVAIGTTTATQLLTVAGNHDATSGYGYLSEIPNDGTTGTATGKLAKLSTAGAAVLATTADTDGMVGVVAGGAGTTGNAQIAVGGQVSCVFDGSTTAGDYVTISTGTAGDCSDAGASEPINQTIGRVLSTNVGAGTYTIAMGLVPAADAGGDVTGTGTTNYVARWTSATNLGTGTLYDNGTNVGIGSTSPTASLDIQGGTITTSVPALQIKQTWNNAATTFDAPIFENITNTASHSGSLLMDLQANGASVFGIDASKVTWAGGSARFGIGASGTSNTFNLRSDGQIGWSSNTSPAGGNDLYLIRFATANLHLGNADAAAPVAQTLGVQNVVAGTTNTAGANFTIAGSQGTGTGVGGSINFQTAPAGVTGTAQNALSTAMTITGAGNIGIGTTTLISGAGVEIESTATTALYVNSNDTASIGLQTKGQVTHDAGNAAWTALTVYGRASQSAPIFEVGATNTSQGNYITVGNTGNVGIGTTAPGDTFDVFNNANSTGYTTISDMLVGNNAGGSNYSRMLFGQVASNLMFIEAANQANTKGGLLLQPYGGDVGIGMSTAPTAVLEVEGSGTLAVINSADTTTTALTVKGVTTFDAGQATETPMSIFGRTSQSVPVFEVGALSTSQGGYLTVGSTGLVGVGTTAPTTALTVVGGLTAASGNTVDIIANTRFYNSDIANASGGSITITPSASGISNVKINRNDGSSDSVEVHLGSTATGNMLGLYNTSNVLTDVFSNSGSVGIGTAALNSSVALQVYSTTKGFLPPLWSTANEVSAGTSLPAGLTVYNTTNNELETFNGTAWEAVGANAADAGGTNTQLQYNNGGDLGGTAGLTWDSTNDALTLATIASPTTPVLTLTGGTAQTTSQPVLSITQTWNNAATTFDAPLFMNITNTASNSASRLLDFQIGGSTKLYVDDFGSVVSNGNVGVCAGCQVIWAGRTTLSAPASSVLHIGPPDVASPVAQTLGVQNVVTGTTDTAGANFTIVGSQGTGLGTGGAIIFQTAPASTTGTTQNTLSTAMTIAGNGNVGIGTSSPNRKLEVVLPIGSLGTIAGFGANGSQDLFTVGYQAITAGDITLTSSAFGPFILRTQSNNNIALMPNGTGSVGIGTTSPNQLLAVGNANQFNVSSTGAVVIGSTALAGLTYYNTADQTTNYQRLVVQNPANESNGMFGFLTQSGGSAGGTSFELLPFATANGGGNIRIYGGSGNTDSSSVDLVGAAATTANWNLLRISQVGAGFASTSGTSNALALLPLIGQSGTAGYNALLINSTETTVGSGSKYLINAETGGTGEFTVSDAGVGYFAGNVGIGTTAPAATLDVRGTYPELNLATSGSFGYAMGRNLSTGYLDITGNQSGFTGINVNGVGLFSGNVGIGTTAPNASALLQVYSTTKGFLPPLWSTANEVTAGTALPMGLTVYNTTNNELETFNGTAWEAVGANAADAGGTNTQLQYNNGGDLGGTAGLTWDSTNDALTLATITNPAASALTITGGALTGTTSYPALNITQIWNNAGGTFTGILENITNTASTAATSMLMDLQVGGVNKFSVFTNGAIYGTNNLTIGGLASVGTTIYIGANGGSDTILSRFAAATLHLGNVDVASPVAQTLGVQNVVAGTTDTAGANFTIAGSQGTGLGVGGSINFQTAHAGSTGTAQNALSTAMTIAGNGNVGIGTTAPSQALTVVGNAIFMTPVSTGGVYLAYNPAGAAAGFALYTGGSKPLSFGTNSSMAMIIDTSEHVAIGSTVPAAALDVTGSIYSRSVNAVAATTINWASGNTQYTTASCGAFSFSGMQDGGSYTLMVEGTTSGTCSFSNSDSPTLTFKLPSNHGATTASTMTLYHFTRGGTNVFVTWMPGY